MTEKNRIEWCENFNQVCKDVFAGDCGMFSSGKSFILNHDARHIVGKLGMDCLSLPTGSKFELSWYHLPLPKRGCHADELTIRCAEALPPGRKLVVFLLSNPTSLDDKNPPIVDMRLLVPKEIKESVFLPGETIPDRVVFIDWEAVLSVK